MRLQLSTGAEVEAVTRIAEGGAARPRCLLLHGNPGSLRDWTRLIPLLTPAADVAALDLPGFGNSPRTSRSPSSVSLDALAGHALAMADALGWHERLFLIGHSHGGGVAQVIAARYPRRVAGIMLVATLGAPAHASYRLLSLPGASTASRLAGWLLHFRGLRPLNRLVLRAIMTDIFAPEPVPALKLEQQLDALAAHPEVLLSMVQVALGQPCAQLLAAASEIRCPTVILHGAADALVPLACAQSIHDCILRAGGRSHFQTIPGAGHMLLDYQASLLADIIIAHLVAVAREGA
jgi:pyruvate dehydrogenase E2 component (dihydrolipoamide acetyltransferase)